LPYTECHLLLIVLIFKSKLECDVNTDVIINDDILETECGVNHIMKHSSYKFPSCPLNFSECYDLYQHCRQIHDKIVNHLNFRVAPSNPCYS
jgi:hypothetical protein